MIGVEMMLKSMGIDPAEIQAAVRQFGAVIVDLKEQQDRIERKLDAVLAQRLLDEPEETETEMEGLQNGQ